jgi:hypothetical protein
MNAHSLLAKFAVLIILLCNTIAYGRSPIRIQFEKGAVSAEWRGNIYNGDQRFKISLLKGQTLILVSPDVYGWGLISPTGQRIGCNEYYVCNGGGASEISNLPMSGDYTVWTDYRMSGCADCPTSRSRNITIVFIAIR